jgi:peptidoglycan/LPS O-acetylase OafA/YrhL
MEMTRPRLQGLDALRGLAALVVVVWHWQHFYRIDGGVSELAAAAQPLSFLLAPFYRSGWLAVDLFFVLSGFTFCIVYGAKVGRGEVGPREFAVRRLSRLYPLHLATLAAVIFLQLEHVWRHGAPFVYANFDLPHLALNLAGASAWGLEQGYSFNGPFWSVSVELLMYAVFFAAARWLPRSPAIPLLLVALGWALLEVPGRQLMARGLFGFGMGWLAGFAFEALKARTGRAHLAGLIAAALAATAMAMSSARAWQQLVPFFVPAFALWILAIGLVDARRPNAARHLAPLGAASYGIYLWHFPLQLAAVLVAESAGFTREVFLRTETFIGFLAVLIAVSWIGHRGFEVPARDALRRRMLASGNASRVAHARP